MGGIATGVISHQKALEAREEYNVNPNRCLMCNTPLYVRPDGNLYQTKRKRYCSHACAAKNSNRVAPKRKPTNACFDCGAPISKNRTRCQPCAALKTKLLGTRTKREAGHRNIRTHANQVTRLLPNQCKVCGYSTYVEV